MFDAEPLVTGVVVQFEVSIHRLRDERLPSQAVCDGAVTICDRTAGPWIVTSKPMP